LRITIAPDSLKESLTASEAANALARGVRKASPQAELVIVPMADGGEGTVAAVVEATGGMYRQVSAADPLGRPIVARWGLCGDGRTAVIEMAAASGLELLTPGERDPMLTSTRGTGQLIGDALAASVERIIIGIGGSATVDGGTGMASQLGARFLDRDGNAIDDCCGGRLRDIVDVDTSGIDPRLENVDIIIASDVTNPLTGPEGAARVYGPQKGADAEQTDALEAGLANLAQVVKGALGLDVNDMPGAGAAGGLGAGLVAFLGARMCNGAQTVMDAVGLRGKMQGSDLVITAEGRMDAQSAFGKTPVAVASVARELGIPAVALVGSVGSGSERVYDCGVSAVFSIVDAPMELDAALKGADELLAKCAESVVRLWLAAQGGESGGA